MKRERVKEKRRETSLGNLESILGIHLTCDGLPFEKLQLTSPLPWFQSKLPHIYMSGLHQPSNQELFMEVYPSLSVYIRLTRIRQNLRRQTSHIMLNVYNTPTMNTLLPSSNLLVAPSSSSLIVQDGYPKTG